MNDTKRQSRVISADMSPQAIEQRLRVVDEMNELCAALGKARLHAGADGSIYKVEGTSREQTATLTAVT